VIVGIQEWDLVWFVQLTPQQVKTAKAQWLEDAMASEKKKKSARNIPARNLMARLSKGDPFKSGEALFSYMPGGAMESVLGRSELETRGFKRLKQAKV
jgi:hypothetical protein